MSDLRCMLCAQDNKALSLECWSSAKIDVVLCCDAAGGKKVHTMCMGFSIKAEPMSLARMCVKLVAIADMHPHLHTPWL